jgi:hypothetical protein
MCELEMLRHFTDGLEEASCASGIYKHNHGLYPLFFIPPRLPKTSKNKLSTKHVLLRLFACSKKRKKKSLMSCMVLVELLFSHCTHTSAMEPKRRGHGRHVFFPLRCSENRNAGSRLCMSKHSSQNVRHESGWLLKRRTCGKQLAVSSSLAELPKLYERMSWFVLYGCDSVLVFAVRDAYKIHVCRLFSLFVI